jgi:pseudaminic acid biosynthesis-associated methylase
MDYRRIKNETKEEQEALWNGYLGDEYNQRNRNTQDYFARLQFWNRIEKKYSLKRVLEIGCNIGYNIGSFCEPINVYGIDVNYDAILQCRKEYPWINSIEGSVFDLPFKDGWFSLCFTVGVLIHIPPAQLKDAMAEIVRCSGKYVLCAEYWAEEERERPFLDMLGVTFERPFDKLYMDMGLTLAESGELTKEQGFNDLKYFLFRK